MTDPTTTTTRLDGEVDLAREQAARLAAEAQGERSAFLAEAGALLASSLDYHATLRTLARIAVPRVADWCAIDVVGATGAVERIVTAHPDPARERLAVEIAERYPPDPDAAYGVPQVLRSGQPELVPEIPEALLTDSAEDEEHLRIIRELGLRSYMVVPLNARGHTLGAITLVAAESGRIYGESDLSLAMDLAARAALAVDNARLYRESEEARAQLEEQTAELEMQAEELQAQATRLEEVQVELETSLEDLGAQHELTRTISENATAALFMMDERGHATYMNRAAEEMTGYSLDEIRDRPLHDAIHHHHPDGRPYPMETCPIDRALPEDYSIRAHADWFVRKDGSFFPVLVAASPIFGDGVPVGTVVEVRDVTEEKRAEAALRESEQRFRFMADAIPVQVWTARPDGALDFVSPQTAAYFGTTPEQILEDGWLGILDPEQVPAVVERWTRSLRTGEPYEVEFRLRDPSGRYRWHLGRAAAQRDEEGRIVRWFGSNTEIQEQKEAELERERLIRAVELERGRLREIFQEAPAFIATLSGPEHRFEMANPLYLKLVGHREVVGRTVAEALPEVVEQGFVDLLDRVYRTGEPFVGTEVQVQIQYTPGAEPEDRYVNFVYQPVRGVDGETLGIFVHGVDVTDQVRSRQAEERRSEELARLARELDQFAYVASHDLKAPLRGIANLSSWIEEDLQGELSPQVREHMDLLRGRVHRMEGLIDGILQYSRAGRVRAKPEQVDVGALLREVVDLLAAPAGAEIRIAAGMPTVSAERLPLQQVFMNLIGNALKYGGPTTRVEVRVAEEGEAYRFSVSDNGPGIAPDYHERIFGLFQTLEARDKVEGTGIGLSLVKKIVENRGGRVWVESDEGEGATFHFTWPRNVRPEDEP